jgi:diguanylate cyclase (GGDEF)-like protein/PAS domain S-box-containing protein
LVNAIGPIKLEGLRVLIAEDELLFAENVRQLIESWGMKVCASVRSGADAIRLAQELQPELILMDVLLEGELDGFGTADNILSQFKIPIIFITGYATPELIHRISFISAAGFLTKPIREEKLLACIQLALKDSALPVVDGHWPVALLNNIDDCMIATDPFTRITYMNPAAEKLTGWSLEELRGKNLSDHIKILKQSIKADSSTPGLPQPVMLLTRHGSGVSVEQSTLLMKDESNTLIGYGMILRHAHSATSETVRQSRQQLKRVIGSIEGIIWESDLERNQFSFVSKQALKFLGHSHQEWLSTPGFWKKHLHPQDLPLISLLENRLVRENGNFHLEYRMIGADRNIIWVKDLVYVVSDETGPIRLCGVMEDITKQKITEQKLLESQEQYHDLIAAAPDIIYSLSSKDGVITMLNPAFEKSTGFDSGNFLGKSFISLIHPEDLHLAIARYERVISGEILPPVELRFRTNLPNEYLNCEITSRPTFQNGKVTGVIEVVRDITERKRANERLLQHALYDPLTGLANRTLFLDRLNHSILRLRRKPEGSRFAVLFIDLDRFKLVNDSLGHVIGDHLLKLMANRLRRCLRPEDTVARIGGDEFVLLIEKANEILDVTSVAERIQAELRTPFQLDGHEIFTTASIGIAFSSGDYKLAEEILRDADTAMYRAKSRGRSRFEVFDEAMHHHVMSILKMETDLRKALDRGQLRVFYQPIISLKTHRITAFEALVRWQHPEQGLIPATTFVALAEETGLIHPIGYYVLKTTVAQIQKWQQQLGGEFPFGVSVNLSAKQFSNSELVPQIEAILGESSLNMGSLAMEITETALMENRDVAEQMLRDLRAMNLKIHIDDFGTGYSSLSYLSRFPIDSLKVDSSFVQSMREGHEILRTILALARNLGLETIVEGIETAGQAEQITQLGFDYGQGFFFAPPMEPDEVINHLKGSENQTKIAP